jgi:hypothetical protein
LIEFTQVTDRWPFDKWDLPTTRKHSVARFAAAVSTEWTLGHSTQIDMSTTSVPTTAATTRSIPWLFSPAVDLCTFLGSALLALALLAIGVAMGWTDSDGPEWIWVAAILMIDVAHVYATGFRVYFDKTELQRRPWLYTLTPLLALLIGIAVYSESHVVFWRGLAYMAVFHFVRQQYGWVALYRSRGGESGRVGWWIDASAIYLATLYPLLNWHCHLPRNFWWFLSGDFTALPTVIATAAAPVYWLSMVSYAGRSIYRAAAEGQFNPGKDLVVATTAICWYVGIISFNSDYAFTVTNVIIHGIPYMVLVYWYRSQQRPTAGGGPFRRLASFLGIVWLLAYAEEMLWDCGLWHERSWLFGPSWELGKVEMLLVPLLAVPQITHYVLDGFIWRRRSNSRFSQLVS